MSKGVSMSGGGYVPGGGYVLCYCYWAGRTHPTGMLSCVNIHESDEIYQISYIMISCETTVRYLYYLTIFGVFLFDRL